GSIRRNPRPLWLECCLASGGGRTYRLGSRSVMPVEKGLGKKCGTASRRSRLASQMVETYATSPIAFAASDTPPVALDGDGLAAIRNTFAAAARRASRLGVDF